MRTPADILAFWYSDRVKPCWFSSTPEFDAEIIAQFGETSAALAQGPFPHPTWEIGPEPALALIIALDQFSRNMFRETADAFQWDAYALGVAERMVETGWDMDIPVRRRAFVYMPFMHAEDLSAQNRCVALTGARLDDPGGVHFVQPAHTAM